MITFGQMEQDEKLEKINKFRILGYSNGWIAGKLGATRNQIAGFIYRNKGKMDVSKFQDNPTRGKGVYNIKYPYWNEIDDTERLSFIRKRIKEVNLFQVAKDLKANRAELVYFLKDHAPELLGRHNNNVSRSLKHQEVENRHLVIPEQPNSGVTFDELDRTTCRMPLGLIKDKTERYCGKKVALGKSYCPKCCDIAYIKKEDKE